MWEVGVVIIDPFGQSHLEVKRMIPVLAPDNIFFEVRMTRSVSALPLGLDQVVNICLTPKMEQFIMKLWLVG